MTMTRSSSTPTARSPRARRFTVGLAAVILCGLVALPSLVANRGSQARGREIVLVAKVDGGMRRGVVSIPHGHLHANVNRLTSVHQVDPLGGMAFYSGVPVEIEPA